MSKKCFHCIRIAVVVINFTLFLIGIAILGSSIFLYVKTNDYDKERAPEHYSEFKKILCYIMGIGAFTIVLSLVGCVGAYHESQIMLSVYFAVILLLFASEVAVGALYFVYKDDKLYTNLKISIENYNSGKIEKQQELFLNSIQKMLKCCGNEGYKDFKPKDTLNKKYLPISCCNYEEKECKSAPIEETDAFPKGCKDQYKEFSQHKLGVVSMIIVVMSIFEFFGMVFSIALCFSIRYADQTGGYMAVKRSMVI